MYKDSLLIDCKKTNLYESVLYWMIGLIVSPRPSDCISLGFGHVQLGIPPKKRIQKLI
jgi:hypothetical protein